MESSEQIRQRLIAAIGERYEILDPIGVGGMATVFLTRHRMHGGFCAREGCNERACMDHHVDRYVLNPCPDPRRIFPLCKVCEELGHKGRFEDEARLNVNGRLRWERRMETEEDREKAKVDELVAKYRGW